MRGQQPSANLAGVAIAGRLYTVNLGIERLILNVISNPAIRALVLCGRDSPIFHTAQGLRALIDMGVDASKRIIGAEGHLPLLANVSEDAIGQFRRQIVLVDAVGTTDLTVIAQHVRDAVTLAAIAPPLEPFLELAQSKAFSPDFVRLESGGHREPLAYDKKGFFVISVDRIKNVIVCRHYLTDNTPAHEIQSRSAERIILGLLRENLVSQMSHAAYLGGELAKAEAALQLGLVYEQDKHLTRE